MILLIIYTIGLITGFIALFILLAILSLKKYDEWYERG